MLVKNIKYIEENDYVKIHIQGIKTEGEVLVDKTDLNKIQKYCKSIRLYSKNGNICPKVITLDNKRISLKNFIMNKSILINKNGNELDCRKENLTSGFTVNAKNNIIKGIKENRYNKNYSVKLSLGKLGEQNSQVKLNKEEVIDIREKYYSGIYSQEQLANMYKVARTTIADIVNFRTWQDESFNKKFFFKEDKKIYIKNEEYNKESSKIYIENVKDNYILFIFKDCKIYIEKSIEENLLYIEVRNNKNKLLSTLIIKFIVENNYSKNNYIIVKNRPKRLKRKYYNEIIKKVGKTVNYINKLQ